MRSVNHLDGGCSFTATATAVIISNMIRGAYRGRFNRLFLVAAVIWFICAAFLPWKWSNTARQHEVADAQALLTSCHQNAEAAFGLFSFRSQLISDLTKARMDLLDSGAPSPSEKEIRDKAAKEFGALYEKEEQQKRLCDDIQKRETGAIVRRHANAWKALFPDHTIWWALALLMVPPVLAYGILIGLGKLASWVWRGTAPTTCSVRDIPG